MSEPREENISSLSLGQTVYSVTDDKFYRKMYLNTAKLRNGQLPGVKLNDDKITVDSTKFDGTVDDILTRIKWKVSPDEALSTSRGGIVEVPIKHREEFDDLPLPDSELLKVLHYYASNRLTEQRWGFTRQFDESALLQLGMLVEKWIDDAVTESTSTIFAENYKKQDIQQNIEKDNNLEVDEDDDDDKVDDDSNDDNDDNES